MQKRWALLRIPVDLLSIIYIFFQVSTSNKSGEFFYRTVFHTLALTLPHTLISIQPFPKAFPLLLQPFPF